MKKVRTNKLAKWRRHDLAMARKRIGTGTATKRNIRYNLMCDGTRGRGLHVYKKRLRIHRIRITYDDGSPGFGAYSYIPSIAWWNTMRPRKEK